MDNVLFVSKNEVPPGSKQMQDRMLPSKKDTKHLEELFGTWQIFCLQEQHADEKGCNVVSPGPCLQTWNCVENI